MAGKRLTYEERLQIEALWHVGQTIPRIAEVIGRDRTTVWREVNAHNSYRHGPKNPLGRHPGAAAGRGPGRGGLYRWGYLALRAQERAVADGRRPKAAKLRAGTPLRAEVLTRLRQRHSPRQIAQGLRREHPGEAGWAVSHETIYQAIYVQGRGSLREELAEGVSDPLCKCVTPKLSHRGSGRTRSDRHSAVVGGRRWCGAGGQASRTGRSSSS